MTRITGATLATTNLCAVHHLQNGEQKRAARVLRTAMKVLNDVASDDDLLEECAASDLAVSSIPLPSTLEEERMACPDNAFLLYNRAFLFHHDENRGGGISRTAMAILLYNMGIAFHRDAVQHNRTTDFRFALTLYDLAFGVLGTNVDHSKSACASTVAMESELLAALANNRGHAFYQFQDYTSADVCRCLVLQLLLSSSESNFLQDPVFGHCVTLAMMPSCIPNVAPAA